MKTIKWSIDPQHSEIRFKVKHLMISNVTGQFSRFDGLVETEGEDFTSAKLKFTADISSISTGNEQRDAHLRSGDFFDAENHPQIIFEGEHMEKTGEDTYKVYGMLTMRGVSKKVTLDAELGGITQDPWGNTRVGFAVNGKLKRSDFGVSFGLLSETGGIALSDDVTISADAQFVKQAVKQAA
jgi:polyisoprenoid-binding protein YceI